MTKQLYKFQEQALRDLCDNKSIAIMGVGTGKTAVQLLWAKQTGKPNVLVITTPSKRNSGDMLTEADEWCGAEWRGSLSSFSVISWHTLRKWLGEHRGDLLNADDWAIVADEVQKSRGYTTGMGRAFQEIARRTDCWRGFTATPGDKWIDLMPFFVATHRVKNKTEFIRRFCYMQTFKGFPEIVGYHDTETLKQWWSEITTSPSTEQLRRELPSETHKVITFKATPEYKRLKQTRHDPETDEFIDNATRLCHELRQTCFTKAKQEWLSDFIEGLGTNCVFFVNYIKEEERVAEIAQKVLKGAKVWRIDGKHHEIPTAETIGPRDIVVAHYVSGGEALNLQFIHYWCSVSPHYAYGTSEQARGRIKRIGQTDPMMFFYLKTIGTIEEDIYKVLRTKSDFAADVWLQQQGIDLKGD